MSKVVKEKNTVLAIVLNFLLPGIGYMYMGKVIVGVGAIVLIFAIYAITNNSYLVPSWIGINVIMVIDMLILSGKNKKKLVEQNMKKCPNCAELIQREAKVCRFCNTKFKSENSESKC